MDEALGKLYETADALARSCSPPVELRIICNRFRIHVRRSSTGRPNVKRAFLLQNGDATEIVLPETTESVRGFTNWERFLIAHELGHYFLLQLKVPRPLGAREYWRTEEVCDRFARQLLLPTREVSHVVSISGTSAADLLGATLHLQTRWAVPWPVAAHEVSGCVKKVHFFKLVADDQGCLRVSASTLPKKREMGRIIRSTSPLGSLLRTLPQNGDRPKEVPVAKSGDFEPLCGAADAAVCRVGLGEYRIATCLA